MKPSVETSRVTTSCEWPLNMFVFLSPVKLNLRSRGGFAVEKVKMGPDAEPTKTDFSVASTATDASATLNVTSRRRSPEAMLWILQV